MTHPTDAAIAQAFAWYTDDFRTDRSATTYDPEVAQRWRDKGWPVWELFTTPPAQAAEGVERVIGGLAVIARAADGLQSVADEAGPEYREAMTARAKEMRHACAAAAELVNAAKACLLWESGYGRPEVKRLYAAIAAMQAGE